MKIVDGFKVHSRAKRYILTNDCLGMTAITIKKFLVRRFTDKEIHIMLDEGLEVGGYTLDEGMTDIDEEDEVIDSLEWVKRIRGESAQRGKYKVLRFRSVVIRDSNGAIGRFQNRKDVKNRLGLSDKEICKIIRQGRSVKGYSLVFLEQ